MQIKLPDINIQPDWTIAGQIKKIGEEFSEVAEFCCENTKQN